MTHEGNEKNLSLTVSLLLMILCAVTNILAQETTGEIQGTVKGSAGAVVPNVQIVISGVDVGFNRTLQTDGDGFYRVRQLPPGIYKVTVAAANGFADQIKDAIQVALGNATTVDFTIGVEAVSGVVNVTGESV